MREPAALAAFLRISSQRRDIPESVRQQIIEAADLLSAPAPASGGVGAVGVCGISADTESKRVLKLHFKHEVTDADRKTIIDAFNTLNRERRSALSTAATPVSEAGGCRCAICGGEHDNDALSDICRRCEETAPWREEPLAKPASSPAGGDVVQTLIDKTEKLIEAADDMGWSCNSSSADQAIREARDAVRAALSQSTSAGRVGE